MYEFIGALFGMSIRSGVLLSLDLPPLFWKWLADDVIDPATSKDLELVDLKLLQNLKKYKQDRDSGLPESEFKEKYDLYMTCLDSSLTPVDLVPSGNYVPVTYENLDQYCDLTLKARLSES